MNSAGRERKLMTCLLRAVLPLLTEVMRQQGDSSSAQQFREVLSQLRDGPLSRESWQFLLSRARENLDVKVRTVFNDALHLYPTKEQTAASNLDRLEQLGKPVLKINAVHRGKGARDCTVDDTGLECELILAKGARVMITDQARLNTIEDILRCVDLEVESLGEVLVEAWSLLKTERFWCHGYTSEADAVKAWSNPSLQRLLRHFSVQRSDKCKYRQSIQIHWNLAIPAIYLNKVGENCLHQIEIMAKKWSNPQDALTLVTYMAIKQKKDTKNKQQYTQHHGGRGVAKQLITKDWTDAKLLLQSDANAILESRVFNKQELTDCLDQNVLSWIESHLKVQ